jgi:protein-disulfide isomerase
MKPRVGILLFAFCAAVLCLVLVSKTARAQDPAQEQFKKSMDAYLQNEDNIAKIGDSLRRYFMKKEQEARSQMEKAEKDKTEQQFKNPAKVDIGDSPVKGPQDAKITIVEFSEFQCPFCKRGASNMEEVAKAYPGQVKFAFKHFPLPFHAQAKGAAAAAIAAKNQGKFWEMHDKLFENQQALGDELYVKLAAELGLNIDKFKSDMADPKTQQIIDADQGMGEKLGIRGTPGYFVNGVQVTGAVPVEQFKPIIDRWLQQSK